MTDTKIQTSLFVVGLMLSAIGLVLFSRGGFHPALTYGTQVAGLALLMVGAFKFLGS